MNKEITDEIANIIQNNIFSEINNFVIDDDINKILNDKTEDLLRYEEEELKDQIKRDDQSNKYNIIEKLKDKSNYNGNIKKRKNLFLCKEMEKELPPHYFYTIIKDKIFPKLNIKKEIKESFILNEKISNLENAMSDNAYFSKKTRKRGLLKPKEKLKKKRGRKNNNDRSDSKHNKESQDNIIKKIKSKLFECILKFINDLLNVILKNNINNYIHDKVQKEEKERLIKKIDYKKIVDDTKRKNNLNFLKMPLKDLFSNNISSKYKTKSRNLNKEIINELLIKEKDNDIIMFILNMTFGDWLDLFLYKKEFNDFKDLKMENDKIKIMSDNFERIDKLLEEIYNLKFGDNYFSFFVYLIYNYERWFSIKKGRKRKNNNKIEKN